MYKIEVKNKKFNGERCNVGFTNGEGLAEDLTAEQKAFFKEMGYTVTGSSEKKSENKKEGSSEKKSEKQEG